MKLVTKKKSYDLTQETLIMGILNFTPDSFSDGGDYNSIDEAVKRAQEMERLGAHIIDIGGESTRPGHDPISAKEEISRITPVIKAISETVSLPISVDTYKAETAQAALESGADIINDIWGAKRDPEMAMVAKEFDAPIVLMHNREDTDYTNFMDDVLKDLNESIEICLQQGVHESQIILDPGVGFAKNHQQNLQVMNNMEQIVALGYPVLLGTSRKRFIGKVLNEENAKDRDIGTGATTCFGITKGASIVRVHNVRLNKQLVDMMDAMINSD